MQGLDNTGLRGDYYQGENVKFYRIYLLNESGVWETVRYHSIPSYAGINDLEKYQLGAAGDMTYFYPDDPKFAKPARWFRYEALSGFGRQIDNVFSELTLYGKKK
jgi:hypothetical protein